MKILTIYLTHHNNTQLRVFSASFKRRFGNISDLNFITARFQDEKITWHDHNLKSLELSREFSRPQLITEFFELISVIKQEKKFDNIILCLEANLGEASSSIISPAAHECLRNADEFYVTLFSSTQECLESAKRECAGRADIVVEQHAFYSLQKQLDLLIKKSRPSLMSSNKPSKTKSLSAGLTNENGIQEKGSHDVVNENNISLSIHANNQRRGAEPDQSVIRSDYEQLKMNAPEGSHWSYFSQKSPTENRLRDVLARELVAKRSLFKENTWLTSLRLKKKPHKLNTEKWLSTTPFVSYCCFMRSSSKIYTEEYKSYRTEI